MFRRRAGAWRVAALVVVTTLLWTMHYDRWSASSWNVPADYSGDALELLARIEAAKEGDAVPFRPQLFTRLGAPFGANWSAYPSSDLLLLWGIGQMARVVGVYPAANLALLLATVTSALGFYFCARRLRLRWEWAWAGALLFAFTFQTFHRGLPHLLLLFSWTVPCAVLSCTLIALSRRLALNTRNGWFCLGTALALGLSNPYNLFLYLQLLGWALVLQAMGPRRRENLRVGLLSLGVAAAAFLAEEMHVWVYTPDTAATAPIERNYGGTEQYALKPLELFLPPATHRWEPMAFLGQRYVRWSDWRSSESFSPYLGLIGIAGLLWLAVEALRAILRRRRMPAGALGASWVLMFSTVGGLTNVMAFFTGVMVFRASNRFSIFLSAIVLLFFASRAARSLRGRSRAWSLAAALLVAVVGVADEMPRSLAGEKRAAVTRRVTADRELGRELERAVPPGAMVFQLPVMVFPEARPLHQLGDYEHFRPYLSTRTLRFSYGSLRGRSRGRWQREMDELNAIDLTHRLESYGFAALYLNRSGYEDGGEGILRALAAGGYNRRIEGPLGRQVVVLLAPAAHPRLPLARHLTLGDGWQSPSAQAEPRWAYGPATASYFNPYRQAALFSFRLVMSGVTPRRVTISVNGESRMAMPLSLGPHEFRLHLRLRPGPNRIDLLPAEPAVRLSEGRDQLHSFALHDSTIELMP